MAPAKKKKKAAANPARGFATTSTVSKARIEQEQPEQPQIEEIGAMTGPVPNTSVSTTAKVGVEQVRELSELTPEELETQLEESELQILVETHGDKSRRDSSRQISRLQTERRLLRSQALPLITSHWLPSEVVQIILDQIQSDAKTQTALAADTSQGCPSDELCIRIWTLRRVLEELGFLCERVKEAIQHLLENQNTLYRPEASTSKESLWGLDDCIQWLALHCSVEELPDYESHKTEVLERLLRDSSLTELPPVTPSTSGMATPDESVSSKVANGPAEKTCQPEQETLPAEAFSDDDDLMPHEFMDRYIGLKRRVHAERPDLTEVRNPGRRKQKPKPKLIREAKEEEVIPIHPKIARLQRRIRKIESDILFDKEGALEMWAAIRLGLVKEAAIRQRTLNENSKEDREENKNGDDVPLERPSSGATSVDEDDGDVGVGDFFSSLPEESQSSTPGTKTMTIAAADGTSIISRDFGKWSGLSPRRVLEEACRARDSACKVKYIPLHNSTLSCRSSLEIHWSRIQGIPPVCPLPGVTVETASKDIRVTMSGISTTSVPQAEAFVSVAALFLVFGPSAKEEKVVLRLPAVWKDLWADFVVIRTDLADSVDRDALRAIRKTVEGLSTAQEEGTNNQSIASSESTNGKTIILNSQTVPGGRVLDSLRIAEMWKMKISSSHYRHMEQSRSSLPIWNYKQELLEVIDHNQIVIICGETGCGKSTQVPAFILENELSNGRLCKIYCTEPRRISAISLARRVSQELGEHKNDVGTSRSLVGYAIRLESHVTETTSLVYATAGIVMRMLERGNDLEDITHLVLDEVHERTIDSDFLLIILRKILHRRPNLKIVLMSATVNAEQFSRYLNGAPIMTIPGRTFPVDTRYLEDAIEATRYTQSHHEANPAYDEEDDDTENGSENKANAISTTYSAHTQQTLATFDEYRIDYELIVKLIQTIATQHSYVEYSQAILVFLPGIAEIRRLNDMLSGDPTFSRQWLIYPLHSTIATEEQEHAFLVPPQGMRKIVLATNIAETGITIPDVTCVVDTGKHKEMRFDERRQLSRLLESFISRANAKQRRGRAGRVQNGLCFHLFTKSRHDNLMAEQQNPEMLRLSLQDLVLRVKLCKIGGIEQTLSEALDPPSPKNVRRAIDALVDVKALTPSEELTPLGKQLARLPLDVFLGKLILLGTIYKCLDACLTIAAILSAKSPFSAAMGARAQADMARLTFKKGDSDLLTVYNAYCAWRRVCQQGGSEFQFCRKNFLSPQTLGNIEDLKAQLATTLVEAGFLQLNDGERASLNRARFYSRQRHFVELPASSDLNVNKDLVLNSVIAWSFYPKLLSRDGKGWRNVSNNQTVSIHPTSVNRGCKGSIRWLSFYHIMQSSNKFYNAHETTAGEDFTVALLCGDAEFKLYSGVIVIDGNRVRMAVGDWKVMLALKALRARLRDIMSQSFRSPGQRLSPQQEKWFEIWQQIFTRQNVLREKQQAS